MRDELRGRCGCRASRVLTCAGLMALMEIALAGRVVGADEPALGAGSESTYAAIAAYESLVLENNPELEDLRNALRDLEETYAKTFELSDSSVSVTGGYAYDPAAATAAEAAAALADPATDVEISPHAVSGSTTLSVPVLPQILFTLQGGTAGNMSLSVTLTPLAGVAAGFETAQQLALQRLAIAYKQLQLQWQSRIALLQYAAAKRRLDVYGRIIENRQSIYERSEQQFEAGLISASDLRSEADALAGALMSHIGAMQQKTGAEKDVYLLCGLGVIPENILGIDVTIDQVGDLISSARETYAEVSESASFTSQSTQELQMQKYYLSKQLDKTWFVEPGVSATVSGSLSGIFDEISETADATVTFSLSAASFHFDEIRELRKAVDDMERDLALNQIILRIDELNMTRSLDSANLTAEMALRNLNTLIASQEQAALDFARGDISEYVYRDIGQNKVLAEVGHLVSLISVYNQLGALLQSYSAAEYGENTL